MTTHTTVRLRDTDAILAAVPALLGYHPTDSAVVIALAGPEKRVKFAARTDMPTEDTWDQQALAAITNATAQHAAAAIVVTYGGRHGTLALTNALTEAGVNIIDVIHTGNTPAGEHPELAAAAALHGRQTLPSRATVANSVAYHADANCDVADTILDVISTTDGRDAYLAAHIKDADLLATLTAAAQATEDNHPNIADLLAVTAAIAYRAGDGTLANAALDRAHTVQPGHTLTYLLHHVIHSGMRPEALDALAAH